MKNRLLFGLAIVGLILGVATAFVSGRTKKNPPATFTPASNPYLKGIFANGIVESYQENGANINIYPEVPGVVTRILISEQQSVARGTPLLSIEDSVQRATVEQQKAQLEAARALLAELKAQPRPENLAVARSQLQAAAAALKTSADQRDKLKHSYDLQPRSVSASDLDNAENAVRVAAAGLDVAQKQLDLVRAGAWTYDVRNQESQCEALSKAVASSTALLNKYEIRAPAEGTILTINAAVGSFVSTQGSYDAYTQSYLPVISMGTAQADFQVRCYVDEILVQRLPSSPGIQATMFFRGSDKGIPLQFVRMQPYVSPKIELSNQRTERVDVRVLPLIFRFRKPDSLPVYRGQLVDVYIAEK